MNIGTLRAFFYILSILFGFSLIILTFIKPTTLISNNLDESLIKNKRKYNFYMRILFVFIGSILILIPLFVLSGIISIGDSSFLFSIASVITIIGNIIINKEFL